MSVYQVTELVDQHGQHYPLQRASLTVGRGAECDLRLDDELASRRHFLLQQTPAGWQVSDLGSSNGTYLNNRRLRPGEVQPVALGDRITAGRTTFVAQLAPARAPQPPAAPPQPWPAPPQPRLAPAPVPARPAGRVPAPAPAGGEIPLWQWVATAIAAAGAVLTGVGVFQPWLRVDAQLEAQPILRDLPVGDLLDKVLSAIGSLTQKPLNVPQTVPMVSFEVRGLETYGPALLIAAGIAIVVLAFDLALRLRRSIVPGLACILASLIPVIVMIGDVQRLARPGPQRIAFGVNLLARAAQVFAELTVKAIEEIAKYIQLNVTPLSGLYFTGFGLALLLVAGIFRTLAPLLFGRPRGR